MGIVREGVGEGGDSRTDLLAAWLRYDLAARGDVVLEHWDFIHMFC